MKYNSIVKVGSQVSFPSFKGEKVYMLPFLQKLGLPEHLSRWQKTIDQMLDGIQTDETIYLMIDQSFVDAGQTQRRPGIHIDGYWNEHMRCHGGGGHGHSSTPRPTKPTRPKPKKHNEWETSSFSDDEALLLASDIQASRGFIGEFEGQIKNGGDCSHIDTSNLKEVKLEANKVYLGNITFLHESVKVEQPSYRTLVRLNIPKLKV